MVSISTGPSIHCNNSDTTTTTTTMPSQLLSQNSIDDINVSMDSMSNVKLHQHRTFRRQLIHTSHDQRQQQQRHHIHSECVNGTMMMQPSVTNHRHLVSSLPRRKSSVLDISSLLCELPESSQEDGSYSSLDDVSTTASQPGDTESLGSPSSFHRGREDSSTPATSPPLSPNNGNRGSNSENINNNSSRNSINIPAATSARLAINHDLERQNASESSWKKVRQNHDHSSVRPVILPPIRSFTSLPDLRSELSNNDHGNLDSRKSSLEQFAAISEVYRSSSPSVSHAEITSRLQQQSTSPPHPHPHESSSVTHPPGSPLTSVQFQHQHPLVRRSSFDVTQTRYTPYTPSTLNPYPQRVLPLDQRRHSDLSGFGAPCNSGQAISDHAYNAGNGSSLDHIRPSTTAIPVRIPFPTLRAA
ncbi:13602_t:CDS:2 [Acaulospora morrowiae]|uniref:13602_t:CDS:1 n=1 Tax=Acaulospora morrowiae TaxID=94023 RepID=A0A9N8VXY6_9GLOM|nr:13602_t:CDS:2 [Acaulospora morrowiae]